MERLGHYDLIERLGKGGMGEVWRAEDERLRRHVAIKILADKLGSDPEWKMRFMREARTIAQLNHPNIATVYAIEEEGPVLFIVMELAEGELLSRVIQRGKPTLPEALRIANATAVGLGQAHAKGIVHRDVKPDNIMVQPHGVKVLDFGIAKQVGVERKAEGLTRGGMIIGTPWYMSPEQALGEEVDARTDIFSLGVVLYEMLTGSRPFEGQTDIATLMLVLSKPVDIATRAPELPSDVIALVAKAMQKKRANRFSDIGEMISAISRINLSMPATPPKARGVTRETPTMVLDSTTPVPAERGRALVADDDVTTRLLLGSILKQRGVPYDEALNGSDAIKRLKEKTYSLIFLDLMMPRIDGWGVLDYLRTMKAPAQRARLYLVTSSRNQTLSELDRGMVSAVLQKPLHPDAISKAVDESLAALSS